MSIEGPDLGHRLSVSPEARAQLAAYQKLSRQAALDCLPAKEPRRYLYDLLPTLPLRPGKAIRPVLCLAVGRALGGSLDELIACAAAFELLHTAFLIHDDIQDGSPRRRGGPALHMEHGLPLALNAGNALAALAAREIVRGVRPLGNETSMAVVSEFQWMVRETVEGQAIDLGWQRDNVTAITVEDYFEMALKKTGWYTGIGPLRIGALLASRGRNDPGWALRLGSYLGTMFQINDDLTSLTEENEDEGPGDDIYEGKRTLMLIHLLGQASGQDRRRLTQFLARPRSQRQREDVQWILDQMHQHGSIEFAQSCMWGLAAIPIS
ncbi:MAG: geranylgeranyl diphosphate synthase, type [Actinomycetota bacterium]|nr:geranylgeranyl diphosphate synthase, type [Actinomycetota bacterium]